MNLFFVCYGGSGSTHLLKRFRGRKKVAGVHARPETYWLPHYFPQQKKSATRHDQYLGEETGYDDLPTEASAKGFQKRSGYTPDLKKSVNDNILDYMHRMKANPRLGTMFSRAPMFRFFTRNKDVIDSPVVFIVRHPYAQYISLTKPHRHLEFVEDAGGVNSAGGIDFFVREWNAYVRDALESGAIITRYEHMDADHTAAPGMAREVLSKWLPSSRSNAGLEDEYEQRLREGTRELYSVVYGEEWRRS